MGKAKGITFMPSYEHKRLVERIKRLDELPENDAEYANWIKVVGHLGLLRDNTKAGELIICGSGDYTYINSVIVSEDKASPLTQYLQNRDTFSEFGMGSEAKLQRCNNRNG